jgi:hypothetical protein
MRVALYLSICVAIAGLVSMAVPHEAPVEDDFAQARPTLGELLPELTVYSPDGREVATSNLRGSYVVLTFGCLT